MLFVGQDMSVRDDGKYYTDDSFYADSGTVHIQRWRTKIMVIPRKKFWSSHAFCLPKDLRTIHRKKTQRH